jgi:urea transport system permease protein
MPEPTTPPAPTPVPERDPKDTVALASSRSRSAYQSSRTFVSRSPNPAVLTVRIVTAVALLLLFFVVIPLLNHADILADYKFNQLGRYLSLAIVALGVDLIWGYTGLLSLCQATFFCIGGYIMAMHMSLPAGGGDVRPEYNNIPQFLFFNNYNVLPWFWRPFSSLPLTLVLGVLAPALVAVVFGFFVFRSRVRGVYFAIITQAVAWGAFLLISRNEMLLGGTNGLTNFYKPYTQNRGWILYWYLVTVALLVLCYVLCFFLVRSRLGKVLVAIRDKETRLYFAGYRPYAFKIFAFAVAAALAGIGGMLYVPQMTIITPQNMSVSYSIFVVIWVATGGRGRLWGAVLGAIILNCLNSALTSDLPSAWPYLEGAIFILVPLLLPDGLVGLWSALERQITSGASMITMFFTVLPLLSLSVFVLFEALGLMPAALQRLFDGVQLKYIALLALLIASSIYYSYVKYAERAAFAARQALASPGAEAA